MRRHVCTDDSVASAFRRKRTPGILLLLASICAVAPASALAKTPTAERLDALVRVLPGGTLDVTETIVFRADESAELVRELPRRRHDGIEILELSMNGEPAASGSSRSAVWVDRRSRHRIRWRLDPAAGRLQTVRFRYRVRGAVQEDAAADVLTWRLPSGDHKWRIGAAAIEFVFPPGVAARPSARVHRAGQPTWETAGATLRVAADDVQSDGWVEATLRTASGAILTAPPAWQAAQRQRASYAPVWLFAGAVACFAMLLPLYAVWLGYEPPRRETLPPRDAGSLPDALPAPVAGAVVRGSASLEHAVAALLALADRGGLRVSEEDKRALGTRTYLLTRVSMRDPLTPYESAALEAAFSEGQGGTVTLAEARTRLSRNIRRFRAALNGELEAAGLLDAGRQMSRAGYLRVSAIGFTLAALTGLLWPLIIGRYGAWPLLVTAGLAAAAIAASVAYAASTPLSDEGVRRAGAWKAFRTHLRRAAKHGPPLSGDVLPYAVALGLAAQWSKHVKSHAGATPDWFRAGTGEAASYAAFVAAAGAQASHPHGAHA